MLHSKLKIKYRKGFTLAEVLVTLAVIGVVAALTIPALINKTNEMELNSARKESYAIFSQAFMRLVFDEGGSIKGILSSSNIVNKFANYLAAQKVCDGVPDCWHGVNQWYDSSGAVYGWASSPFNKAIILNNSSLIGFKSIFSNCDFTGWGTRNGDAVCNEVVIDINGFRGPNRLNKDIYILLLQKDSIWAWGAFGTDLLK